MDSSVQFTVNGVKCFVQFKKVQFTQFSARTVPALLHIITQKKQIKPNTLNAGNTDELNIKNERQYI